MVIFVIIGAIIGAGFASGEEIYLFFYRFGMNGIYGLIISTLIMGAVTYKTFLIVLEKNIKTYKEFLEVTLKNKRVAYITNIIINTFLLSTFVIMISGFGAYFEQEFGISHILGSILLSGSCFLVILNNIKGVTKVSSIVVPLLIFCIIIISIVNIGQIDFSSTLKKLNSESENSFWWLLQSILYCSYNMIVIIPVLVNLRKYIKSKRQITVISTLVAIAIFILAMSVFLLLTNINGNFKDLQMPAVYAISSVFPQFRILYGIVILFAIFTTAISDGVNFLENTVKNKKYFPQLAAAMCIIGVLISNIGFSNLVEILFPLFGYFGIVQIINILVT